MDPIGGDAIPKRADAPAGSDDLLTVEEAARYLGVSRHKIGRLLRSGDLVPYVSDLDRRRRLVLRSHLDHVRTPHVETVETAEGE